MTFEKHCIFANTCTKAGDPKHCNFTCYPHAFAHGTDGKSGIWKTSGVPKSYKDCRISNLPIATANPKAYNLAVKYGQNILKFVVEQPTGLLLYSIPTKGNPFGTGTGKTTTAVTLLNEFLIERSRAHLKGTMEIVENPALFVKATEMQNSFNAQFRGSKDRQEKASERYYSLKEAIKRAELVVFDDIATRGSRVSEAYEDELYEMLDYRNTNSLTTIFTSNVNLDELSNCLGERIASRIAGMTIKVAFSGEDNRLDALLK